MNTLKFRCLRRACLLQDIDFAITDLTITSEREKAVDFTTPFMNLGISILFGTPEPAPPKLFAFMLPFSNAVRLDNSRRAVCLLVAMPSKRRKNGFVYRFGSAWGSHIWAHRWCYTWWGVYVMRSGRTRIHASKILPLWRTSLLLPTRSGLTSALCCCRALRSHRCESLHVY